MNIINAWNSNSDLFLFSFSLISGFLFFTLFFLKTFSKRPINQNHIYTNAVTMIRMAGSKLLARLLLLISSITLISLLALARCGIGGLVDNNLLLTDDGKWWMMIWFKFYLLLASQYNLLYTFFGTRFFCS